MRDKMLNQATTTRIRSPRRARGAVMMETVFITPFIMIMLVLIIYLGWNFRRLAQITNMDRYSVWEEVTPGAPGPDKQGMPQSIRNPRLNEAFYGLNGDLGLTLDELRNNDGYIPRGHELLRNSQTDETFSYFDEFIERNPRAIRERFEATHEHISDMLERMNMSELTRNGQGHSRMNGDWRYVNGIRYNAERDQWEPAHRRVSPGQSLREVFFVDLDDGLEPYVDSNRLAQAIREFYTAYPSYRGPDFDDLDDDVDDDGGGSPF